MTSSVAWTLHPGEPIRRTTLHSTFGGGSQGGICPSRQSDNIFLFTDPRSGRNHGYIDEWAEDGTFRYTGEGQRGNQEMTHGNKAVLDSARDGRALRLFDGSRGIVRYVGEFLLDEAQPYTIGRALETGGGPERDVIKFHLVRAERSGLLTAPDLGLGGDYRPADESVVPAPARPSSSDPDLMGRNLNAHRRLQNALAQAVTDAGLSPLSPMPEDPDFDLAWRTTAEEVVVCEVKSLTPANETRQLRMGIGQVLDYVDQASAREKDVRGVLWVERAPSDLRWIALCQRAEIQLAWPGQEHLVIT